MSEFMPVNCPDCGHGIDDHATGGCAYRHLQETLDGPPMCDCVHSPSIIAASAVASQAAQIAELKAAIVWALGYTNFPGREDGQGAFYWRKELRERSGISHEEAQEIAARLLAPVAGVQEQRQK